ncbi:toxin HigB-2 [Bacteroidia bacterium]|nr:toxin HigB-2 [Bacteroidia bacterium]
MNYVIVRSENFDRNIKRLSKKYYSLADDLQAFQKELLANPAIGDNLGNNIRKVRMAISSKNKGKRGGARIITYHLLVDEHNGKIYLLTIYDKNEQASISRREIEEIKREYGLF